MGWIVEIDFEPLVEEAKEGRWEPLVKASYRDACKFTYEIAKQNTFHDMHVSWAEACCHAFDGMKLAVKSWKKGAGRSFKSFLWNGCRFTLLKELEKLYRQRKQAWQGLSEHVDASTDSHSHYYVLASSAACPAGLDIQKLLDLCSPREREALERWYLREQSTRVVAEDMGFTNHESVHRTIDRAKKRLRGMFTREEAERLVYGAL